MVLPELIPVTYAKVRAELRRELLPVEAPLRDDVLAVVTSSDGDVLLQASESGPQLPRFGADADRPLWRTALQGVSRVVVEPELIGWAGASSTLVDEAAVLRIVCREITAGSDAGFVRVDRLDAVRSLANDKDRATLAAALKHEHG